MRVLVFPADSFGCGMYRMIWPGEALANAGYDVRVVPPAERSMELVINHGMLADVVSKQVADADIIVFQRVTHLWIAQAIKIIRDKGKTVIVDVDDDLTSIHPDNPAWWSLHPRNFGRTKEGGEPHLISWKFLNLACQNASLVTVSTPGLLPIYAQHGRGVVLPNYLPDHAFVPQRTRKTEIGWSPLNRVIGWPASLHSHPNDPAVVGNAIDRLTIEGESFTHFGDAEKTAQAFGLTINHFASPRVDNIFNWSTAIANIGVGICPLADTKFNSSKSRIKPLELCAAGVPWVASPRNEYRELQRMGVGFLADKPKHWFVRIKELLDNQSLREEQSTKGRIIADKLRIKNHAGLWWDAWKLALDADVSQHQ